jgi:hypothetical protein
MDHVDFDRFTKTLADGSGRRRAIKASLAGVLVAVTGLSPNTLARNKKKRKGKKRKKRHNAPAACLPATQSCNATAECCGAEVGVVACRAQPIKGACQSAFPGLRCCGLDGVVCNPQLGSCDCCDEMLCLRAIDGQFRCQPPD